MFDKYKARFAKFEEDHESVRKVKKHLQDNKQTYLVGVGCLSAGYLLRRPNVITVVNEAAAPVFNNTNIGNVVNNTVNNGGHCTKIVQRLSDKEIFEQAGDAAFEIAEKHGITYDRARWMLSRHMNGKLANVFGETYKTIGTGTTG